MLNYSLSKLSSLLLACCLLLIGVSLPSNSFARVPTQIEAAQATALLSGMEECAKDSLAGAAKWDTCVEDKYAELKGLRLESVDPDAHWYAAMASWHRGDIALTNERLNLIFVTFPDYTNAKLSGVRFTTLNAWLQFIDEGYAPVKLRQPLLGKPRQLQGPPSQALTFANWHLTNTKHFEGFLLLGEYTFGDTILVVTADGITEKPVPVVEVVSSMKPGNGIMVVDYPKVTRTYPLLNPVEWDSSLYGLIRWQSEADCLAGGENSLAKHRLQEVTPEKPIEYEMAAGTYWLATYLWYNKQLIRQEVSCREVVIVAGEKIEFTPRITTTPVIVDQRNNPPTEDFVDVMALVGSGFRADSPNGNGWASYSLLLEGRMTPEWWINADPNWTLGSQFWLDLRPNYGTYDLAGSWGFGFTMGRDWEFPTKAGGVSILADAGLMLGSGAHGTNCTYNPSAMTVYDVDMTCGVGMFPKLNMSHQVIPGSFHSFYGALTGRLMVRWNMADSNVFIGAGAWGAGQLFMPLTGAGWSLKAQVVLTDGTRVEVPYQWKGVVGGGVLMPGVVIGVRLP